MTFKDLFKLLGQHLCISFPGHSPCLLLQGHCGDVHGGVLVASMQDVVTLCLPGNVFRVDARTVATQVHGHKPWVGGGAMPSMADEGMQPH